VLLLCSLFLLFLVPFTDTRAKYLLLFILLGCLLLQLPMLQGAFGWPDSTLLMLAGNRSFRIGYAAVLVGLYLLTVLAHGRKDSRTWQNIAFSLTISEQRVTIGRPFLIRYALSTIRATPIKSIRILFAFQQYVMNPRLKRGGLPLGASRDSRHHDRCPGDIDGGVPISVIGIATVDTTEGGLALAVLFRTMATRAARARRMAGVNGMQWHTGKSRLVGKTFYVKSSKPINKKLRGKQ